MIFAEIDPTGWAVIIGAATIGLSGIVTSALTLILSYKERQRQEEREHARIERDRIVAEKAEKAAVKVEEVRRALSNSTEATVEKLDEMAKVGEKTHALVNSAMLEQKRIYAAKCKAASIDTPTEANLAEATAAEEVYLEHKAKQEAMEAKDKAPKKAGVP
jgi:aspartokinase